VAGRVKNSAGTIGYVELRYAKQSGIAFGAVKNRAGKAIVGSAEAVTAAAAEAMKVKQTDEPYSLHELTYSLTDAEGENSYPISGFSYCVLYRKQPAATGQALKAFLLWASHEGQAIAPKLDYAALPAELVKKIEARLEQIELQ
jgi:phosphate transport system substrate-binding protein